MTLVYVVSNQEKNVRQAILDTAGGVGVESLGEAMHLRDKNPDLLKIFVIDIREYEVP